MLTRKTIFGLLWLFIVVVLILFSVSAKAVDYFIKPNGNDALDGKSAANAWRNLSKLNTVWASGVFVAGDNIYLERGGTYYGYISVGESGTSTARITVSAYGSGANPVVTGLTTLSTWTSVGGGIYETPTTTALLPYLNMVLVDGVQRGMGRWPNASAADGGYNKFESFVGTSSITDAQLSTTPYNWTGAEVVIKPYKWLLNRSIITNHVGGTLSFAGDQQPSSAGYGYFIQNDVRTLDALYEWYHIKSTERIRMYFGAELPSNHVIQAATIDSLVYSSGKSYISISNITFKGANGSAIRTIGSGQTGFTVDNCDIQFTGIDGVNIFSSIGGLSITNSTIQDCNNNGILASQAAGVIIRDNIVRNTYMIPGMGAEGDGHGWGIRAGSGTIEYNRVINSGYSGIYIGGSNTTIQYNYIDSFCIVKDDGGGIYTSNGSGSIYTNRIVRQNIILHGIGNFYGTPAVLAACNSIYFDNQSNGATVTGNSAAYSNSFGMFFHDSRTITASGNTFYNNTRGQFIVDDDNSTGETSGLTITGNIFATKYATEPTMWLEDNLDNIGGFGTFNSNIYAGLLGNNVSIVNTRSNLAVYEYHDLASWRLRYGQDAAGSYSLKNVAPYRDLAIVGTDKIPQPNNNAVFNVCCEQWGGPSAWSDDPTHAMGTGGHMVVTPDATQTVADVSLGVGSVLAGTPYILRFSVKGSTYSSQGSFSVRLSVGSTNTDYQWYKIPNPSLGVQQVEMLFVPTINANGTVRINAAEGGTPFYLDNIHFFQTTATVTNPSDSIRFEYNDTKVNKVVALDGTYKDVYGTSYPNTVTLTPFTSKVLIFNTTSTVPVVKQNPTITWGSPVAITYGTALSTTQLGATASVPGTFAYNYSIGQILNAGTYTLSLTFTPTDQTNYNTVTTSRSLTVNKATATLTLSGTARTYTGSPISVTITTSPVGLTVITTTYAGVSTPPTNVGSYTVSSGLTNANYTASPVSGTLVISKATATLTASNLNQTYNGAAKPITVTTAPAGLTGVSVTYDGSATAPTNAGSYAVVITLTHANYTATQVNTTLTIAKANPTVSWATPTAITYGTAIGGSQLNATASVAGSFTYTPITGSILNAGTQVLSVSFAPTDATNYNSVTNTTVNLVVNKAVATITLGSLAQTYSGTAKSATAVTSPVGLSGVAITYDGSATAPTNAGSYAVSASLSNTNYTATPVAGTLVISKATATISLSTLTHVYNGTPRTATATTSPAGLTGVTITYDGSATAPTNVGSYTVVASLTNVNYTATNAGGTLVISKATPTIVWNNPVSITYGTPLSATQLSATSTVAGAFTYSPVSGTILNAGSHTLTANFTPTDATNYNVVNGTTRPLMVNKATATISILASSLSQQYDGTPKPVTVSTTPAGLTVLTVTYTGISPTVYSTSSTAPTATGSYTVNASLTNTNYTASAVTATLTISTSAAAVTITNISQTYTGRPMPVTVTVAGEWPYDVTYNGSAVVPTNAGTYTVVATINDGIHSGTDTETYIIHKANPIITWSNPAQITYGTPLSGTQLNASSATPGTFTYTPASGVVLNAGTQILSTTFAPTDGANYNSGTKTATLVVAKAVATITLSNLAQNYDGTPKSATAVTNPAGLTVVTITYAGSTTPPTAAGSYAVMASLNNSNYTGSQAGTLVISASTASITISNLLQVYDGTTQPVTVATNPAGLTYTLTYNGSSTVPIDAGSYTTVATITQAGYSGSDTKTLVISKATPVITWNNPAAITYGTALSATQLNATANAAGTFVYSPVSGTVLNQGTQTLSTTFTPTSTANYNTVVKTVTVVVNGNSATLTIDPATLLQMYNGTPKPVIVTSSPAGLSGIVVTYNGSTTPPTNAGSYSVSATLTNANYTATPANATLVIGQGTYGLTWGSISKIKTGQLLTSTQLNATSTIAGTFTYNPPANTYYTTTGRKQLVATFTPADNVNYATRTISNFVDVYGNPNQNFYIDPNGVIYLDD